MARPSEPSHDAAEEMLAARIHQFGPPSVIRLERALVPQPGPGEVLIRVRAAGVGPWDGWIRAGRSVLPQPLPLTLGSDFAGVVASVGDPGSPLRPGEEVLGVTNRRFTGAYAEYAIASAGMIAPKPPGLAYVDAASVPVVAVTAWQALFHEARLSRGDRVLILGAAGNVGALAVQLALAAGLEVVAAGRGSGLGHLRRLGVSHVVDVGSEPLEPRIAPVDAVIDLVGGDAQLRSFEVLKRGGRLVSAVSAPNADKAAEAGADASFFLVSVTSERLASLARQLKAGELRTCVGAALPLHSARQAHEMLENLRPRPAGKIVLEVSSG